jgi:hypothetical protein
MLIDESDRILAKNCAKADQIALLQRGAKGQEKGNWLARPSNEGESTWNF